MSSIFKKAFKLLKSIPVDFGQYEVRYTTKGKQILFSRLPARGCKVLDLGCRDCYWSKKLAGRGCEVVSVDLEPISPGVTRLDANDPFPFPDESFDLVWCAEVIEHVVDPRFTIGEVSRVLKSDGTFLMTTPNSDFWVFRMFRFFGIRDTQVQNDDHRQFFAYSDMPGLMDGCKMFGYFPYLFFKKTITRGFSLLSPTIVVEWHPAPAPQTDTSSTHAVLAGSV